jgi:hypothetical protein
MPSRDGCQGADSPGMATINDVENIHGYLSQGIL